MKKNEIKAEDLEPGTIAYNTEAELDPDEPVDFEVDDVVFPAVVVSDTDGLHHFVNVRGIGQKDEGEYSSISVHPSKYASSLTKSGAMLEEAKSLDEWARVYTEAAARLRKLAKTA